MITDKAYLVGINRYSFRAGIPAEIMGVDFVTPDNRVRRLCFHVRWRDRYEDWVPIEDNSNYEVISFTDLVNGNIPSLTK